MPKFARLVLCGFQVIGFSRAMQTINVRTTQNVVIQYSLASLGDRILAFLVDFLILFAYILLLWVVTFYAFSNVEWGEAWAVTYFSIVLFPLVFYHLLFEIFMDCQTPGKRAMDIRIVRLDGANPTVGNHIMRWLCRPIDIGPIGVVTIAASDKSQRLGDMAADTVVVKLVRQKEITAEEVFVSTASDYTPSFPQVTQLEPRDIELVQRALEAYNEFGNTRPVVVIHQKIKTLLGIESDLSATEFLSIVVKDYNHLTAR
jgi:uncharacterized RDD family membrane protein YckC